MLRLARMPWGSLSGSCAWSPASICWTARLESPIPPAPAPAPVSRDSMVASWLSSSSTLEPQPARAAHRRRVQRVRVRFIAGFSNRDPVAVASRMWSGGRTSGAERAPGRFADVPGVGAHPLLHAAVDGRGHQHVAPVRARGVHDPQAGGREARGFFLATVGRAGLGPAGEVLDHDVDPAVATSDEGELAAVRRHARADVVV